MALKAAAVVMAAIVLVACSNEGGDSSSTAGERSQAASAPSPKFTAAQAASGKALHAKILDKYPDVDPYYRKASLWAATSDQPLVVIVLPTPDWQALSKAEKHSLGAYAASLVDAVRSSPFDYTGMKAEDPLAPMLREKTAAMTAKSWGIMTGEMGPDGRDVMSDQVVVQGQ